MSTSGYQYIQKHVIVGASGTGKSSILVQLTDSRFLKDSEPTIGVEFGSRIVALDNSSKGKLQIWDTAGQESFRSITRSYYRGAEGALLVFDVTHRTSFLQLDGWLDDLRAYCEDGVIVTVIGNKIDLIERETEGTTSGESSDEAPSGRRREVSELEARTWADANQLRYLETSAKTGHNIEAAFETTAREIHAQVQANRMREPRRGRGAFPTAAPSTNSCCGG